MLNINRYEDNDDRALDRKVERQFNPIGQVETVALVKNSAGQEGMGVATAFLASPCYIFTNNHAVFGDDFPAQPRSQDERDAVGEKYKMKFSVNVGVTLPFAVATYATPVVWGDRDGANRRDWALLKLSSCLGAKPDIGWMDLDINQSSIGLKGKDVAIASYPGDRGFGAQLDEGKSLRISYGKVTGYNDFNDTVRYNVSTAPGSSGGVVIITDAHGNVRVVGMHQGGHRDIGDLENYEFKSYSDKFSNQFINVRSIIECADVRQLLIDDTNRFGRPNPNQRNLLRGIPKSNGQGTS